MRHIIPLRTISFCLFLNVGFLSILEAIPRPKKGKFPRGFWHEMEVKGIGQQYGDPGWIRRLREFKQRTSVAQAKFFLPVILGSYTGESGNYDSDTFQGHLFGDNSTGSLSDYYEEISYDLFSLTGTVYGWYGSSKSRADAVDDPRAYIKDVLELSDTDIDFSLYDNDGADGIPNSGDDDGIVDGVAVVYSGDWTDDNIWPHMSSLLTEYTTGDLGVSGEFIKVSRYFICPEKSGVAIRDIGVFAHEFGHILGLPDLYDRTDETEGPDYDDSEGLGNWCLMAGGSWGGDGSHEEKPSHMSAWCKVELGWVSPTVLKVDESALAFPDAETNAFSVKIFEDNYYSNRYFLIENRQKTGFDQYLRGDGLLIYHVDENRRWGPYWWSSGPVNNDPTHKFVDLEEADGNDDLDKSINRSDSGDPFPGSTGNTEFSDYSIPEASSYSGKHTGIKVSNISSSSQNMTADVIIRKQYGYSIIYDELGITSGWGYQDSLDSWGGVLFKTEDSGYLTEIDLGIRRSATKFKIIVYESFDGSTPSLPVFESGNHYAPVSGWYTVPVDGVFFGRDETFFAVQMVFEKPYAISFDNKGIPIGRSYFSGNGDTYSSRIGENGDINLRAKLVYSKNGPPIAFNINASTNEDESAKIFLSGNDPDKDLLQFTLSKEARYGSLSQFVSSDDSSATITYSPLKNFHGNDSFNYKVFDGVRYSEPATVNISVASVNDKPISFEIDSPSNGLSVTIDDRNISDSLVFKWHPSYDVDMEALTYIWIGSEFLTELEVPSITVSPEPLYRPRATIETRLSLSDLYSIIDQSDLNHWTEASEVSASWTMMVHDGQDTVEAENGPFDLVIKERVLSSLEAQYIPETFLLRQNFPNPFNPITTMLYDLPEDSKVSIFIYDLLGRHIRTLIDQDLSAGYHKVLWDATDDLGRPVSAGVYLYQIQAGEFTQTRKMLLLK